MVASLSVGSPSRSLRPLLAVVVAVVVMLEGGRICWLKVRSQEVFEVRRLNLHLSAAAQSEQWADSEDDK